MDVRTSIEHETDVYKNIKIEIPRVLFNEKMAERVQKAAAQVQLKGFRKGKAPRDMIEKLYGGHLRSEVLGELINSAYSAAVAENHLRTIGYPEIKVEKLDGEEDIEVIARVSLIPEPKISNYFSESFEVDVYKPCEHDLDAELESIQERFAKTEDVDGRTKIQENDLVTIDYTGSVEGQEHKDLCGNDAVIEMRESRAREELIKALVGVDLGATVDVSVVLTEQFEDKELVGKTAVYKVTPKKIQVRVLPELNDELAEKSKRAKNLADLKENIKKQQETAAERQNSMLKEQKLFEQLIEKNPFDVPQALLDEEIRSMLFEYGALDPKAEESYQRDLTMFRESLNKPAEMRVRRAIITEQLVKQEGIEIDDAEIENWLEKRKDEIGCSRDEVNKMYSFPRNKEGIRNFVANQQMLDRLLEKANITEVEKTHEHNH